MKDDLPPELRNLLDELSAEVHDYPASFPDPPLLRAARALIEAARDSSWRPPLELPTEPTWGIASHTQQGAVFAYCWMDGDEFWFRDLSGKSSRSWRAHNILDFIPVPLTDEQVARIEAAR